MKSKYLIGVFEWNVSFTVPHPFQARPFECADFLIFAARVRPGDHVSEGILEKVQIEADIWPV